MGPIEERHGHTTEKEPGASIHFPAQQRNHLSGWVCTQERFPFFDLFMEMGHSLYNSTGNLCFEDLPPLKSTFSRLSLQFPSLL